jgi:protease-4
MNFLKNFLASVLGTITAFILFFSFLLIIISASASVIGSSLETTSVSKRSVLNLNLNVPIVDRTPSFDELQTLLGLNDEVLGLPEVIKSIDIAASNPNIEGIRLRSDIVLAGWSQTRSIRNALRKFKESGKFIYAYGDFYSQKGYYLASVSDSIFMNPVGVMEFKGLASEVLYFKDFQDEFGVKMEVVRHGKYKSAVEPYLENEMSPANRFQIQTLLDDIWFTLKNEIAVDRNLEPELLDAIANENRISIPQDAVQEHLVDALMYEDDFDQLIKTKLELEDEDKLKLASIGTVKNSSSNYNSEIKDRVAVVYAQGPILYGEGAEGIIAQGIFERTLNDLAKDDWIKAVVLRIESPGGSALTSELIWHAIEKLKEEKPVIVSIGDVAASGGYYIAAGADKIFADPLSITGSIGVFATLPNASGLMNNLGIHSQSVETHEHALGYSPFQPLTENFKSNIRKGIENTYETFKQRVIEGRSLSPQEVENLAQGRVWSGKQALDNGLVDELGELSDALKAAAEAAEISEYNVLEYPKFEQNLENMLGGISPSLEIKSHWIQWLPKTLQAQLKQPQNTNPLLSIQTLMPFELSIQ